MDAEEQLVEKLLAKLQGGKLFHCPRCGKHWMVLQQWAHIWAGHKSNTSCPPCFGSHKSRYWRYTGEQQ